MMNAREAAQRNTLNCVCMCRDGSDYVVTLQEWSKAQRDKAAYYTDDIEDAVLTGAAMRHRDSAMSIRKYG